MGRVHAQGLHLGDGRPDLRSRCPVDEGLWDMFAKDIPRGATSYTVSLDQLRQGVTYEFRVVAVNQAGYGEPSSPSTTVSGRSPARGPRGGGWTAWSLSTAVPRGDVLAALSASRPPSEPGPQLELGRVPPVEKASPAKCSLRPSVSRCVLNC